MVPAAAAVEAWKRREDPTAAAQQAEQDELHRALPPQLDEFGRDENAARRDRAAARSTARAAALEPLARRLVQEPAAVLCNGPSLAAAAAGGPASSGGTGGDDERRSYYARRMRELREVAGSTLLDVAEEFVAMSAVLRRVGDFKARFPAQYSRAYVSEALPALMSVYVRLQLLAWDPLYCNGEARDTAVPGTLNFEEHDWFRDLLEFSGDGAARELRMCWLRITQGVGSAFWHGAPDCGVGGSRLPCMLSRKVTAAPDVVLHVSRNFILCAGMGDRLLGADLGPFSMCTIQNCCASRSGMC